MALNEEQLKEIKEGTAKAFGGNKPKVEPAPANTPAPTPAAEPTPTPQAQTPAPAPEPTPAPVAIDYEAMPDEEFEKILAKRTGGKVKSLADLNEPAPVKTKDQLEAEERKEKQDAIEWALGTNQITREEYENGIRDKAKSNREISLAILTEELKEDNPKITAEEVEEIYKDIYHEDKDDDNPYRKAALKKEAKIANQYKKEKYGKLDSIDSDYRNYRTEVSRHKEYTKQVKSVMDTIPKENTIKVPIKIDDKDEGSEIEIKYTMDDADIKAIRDMMNEPEIFRVLSSKGDVKDDAILKMANYHIEARVAQKQRESLLKQTAMEAIKATLAWAKNIPQTKAPISTTTVLNNTNGSTKTPPSHAAYHNTRKN